MITCCIIHIITYTILILCMSFPLAYHIMFSALSIYIYIYMEGSDFEFWYWTVHGAIFDLVLSS